MIYQYRINQVIEAIQFREDNISEVVEFAVGCEPVYSKNNELMSLYIPRWSGWSGANHWYAKINDWIVKNQIGVCFPVEPHIFEAFYLETEESQ